MKPALDAKWQAEVLAAAAALLSSMPVRGYECRFRPMTLGGRTTCRAVFVWPGVVMVLENSTGQLLAESAPGLPLTPKSET